MAFVQFVDVTNSFYVIMFDVEHIFHSEQLLTSAKAVVSKSFEVDMVLTLKLKKLVDVLQLLTPALH